MAAAPPAQTQAAQAMATGALGGGVAANDPPDPSGTAATGVGGVGMDIDNRHGREEVGGKDRCKGGGGVISLLVPQ
jgi:hypothetical protein